jgi:hypothetical protein
MPRPAWSLYAYQLIEPDEQLDLFACQEVRASGGPPAGAGAGRPYPVRRIAAGATALVGGGTRHLPRRAPVRAVQGHLDAQRHGMRPVWPEL